jgi:hypothetical protein
VGSDNGLSTKYDDWEERDISQAKKVEIQGESQSKG